MSNVPKTQFALNQLFFELNLPFHGAYTASPSKHLELIALYRKEKESAKGVGPLMPKDVLNLTKVFANAGFAIVNGKETPPPVPNEATSSARVSPAVLIEYTQTHATIFNRVVTVANSTDTGFILVNIDYPYWCLKRDRLKQNLANKMV